MMAVSELTGQDGRRPAACRNLSKSKVEELEAPPTTESGKPSRGAGRTDKTVQALGQHCL